VQRYVDAHRGAVDRGADRQHPDLHEPHRYLHGGGHRHLQRRDLHLHRHGHLHVRRLHAGQGRPRLRRELGL